MVYSKTKVAGAFFFIGAAQFIIGIMIAEALHPTYSVSTNYVSDLGVGPSSTVFNSSVFLLGLLSLVGTCFLRHLHSFKTMNKLLVLMAIGAMGVGIITKDYTLPHGAMASMTFFFSALSAIASARLLKNPLSPISIVLGATILGALALFSLGMVESGSITSDIAHDSNFYLGLGPGGMERMVIYPALVWLAGFSASLTAQPENPTEQVSLNL